MSQVRETLLAMVADDLAGIEAELHANLNPYLDLVHDTASHLLFSGGKRFRPLLMVLAARLCGYAGDGDRRFSTAFEYIHAATLLHDDLVDGATLRRGKPVAHGIWGAPTAVLVGDFLLARALTIGADTGRLRVIQALSYVTEQMSQGEIHQLMRKGDMDLTEAEYREVIRRKTAVLIQAACRVGAIIADAPETVESALAAYGLNIGMAFQMADDLLDYTADTRELGKTVGADLREGKLTLPVIHALENARPVDREEMARIIGRPAFSETDFTRLVKLLEQYDGIRYTRQCASAHITAAKAALDVFEPSPTRDVLLFVADYALKRHS